MDLWDILAATGTKLVVIRDGGGEGDPVGYGAAAADETLVWLLFYGEEVLFESLEDAKNEIYYNSEGKLALKWAQELPHVKSHAYGRIWSALFERLQDPGHGADEIDTTTEPGSRGRLTLLKASLEGALSYAPDSISKFRNWVRSR